LEPHAFSETLLGVLKVLDEGTLSISGKERHTDWENGWSENLKGFVESNYDLDALVPRYVRKIKVKRLFSTYIMPADDDFEVNFYTVYRHYLFNTYFSRYDPIYEFGCGTGYNLSILARLFPDKRLFGLDWAESSTKLVNAIASAYRFTMEGRLFDFFHPDYSLHVPEKSAFLTLNAMEQLGTEYDNFLEFILSKRPRLCVNSEPFIELYDENNLLDYLAAKYHRKRNYLNGYLDALRKLEEKGRIEILKEQRVYMGSIYHEGYSYVVWKAK
jgi:SAM-dependent methyltransferase